MNVNSLIAHNVSIDTLSDELLLIVFSHLSFRDILLRCAVVNKRWYRLSLDESLWKVIRIKSAVIPLRSLAKLLNRGIRDLSFSNAIVQDPLNWIRSFVPNKLHTLDFSSASISSQGLGQLLKSTSELVCLRLKGCSINHIALKAIASNRKLKVLDLSACTTEYNPFFGYKFIFESCLMLENVNLSGSYMPSGGVESKSLRRLTVRHCGLFLEEVKAVVIQCPNLTHLDIGENFVNQRAAETLKTFLPRLVELKNDNPKPALFLLEGHLW